MTPQPATIMNDLIRQINCAKDNNALTKQALLAFEDDAYKLRSVDVADGDMVLGIIAANRGDIDEMHRRFKNAKAFNGDTAAIDYNYGFSLFLCGDYGGAIQMLSPYADNDKQAAMLVAIACRRMGLNSRADYYFDLSGENEPCNNARQSSSMRIAFIGAAMQTVENSFVEERGIWESLSRR